MKDISREVSDISREVLECYQVRKTGKQKAAFRARITEWAAQNGYTVSERGRIPAPVLEAYDAAH